MSKNPKDPKDKKPKIGFSEYFNKWKEKPEEMAKSEGVVIGGVVAASVIVPWLLPVVGPALLFTAACAALATQPVRERLPDAAASAATRLLSEDTKKKMLPNKKKDDRKPK